MIAYCYASGLIQFGRKTPDGAIAIAAGPAKPLRDLIDARARHGYETRKVKGRPTKIPGTECLLVPGVPEAPDQEAGGDALGAFCKWIGEKPPKGITVFGMRPSRRPGRKAA
jgi:hypothetical protein